MDLDDKSDDYEDMSGEEAVDDIDDDELGGNLPVFSDELYKLKEKAMGVKKAVMREKVEKNSDDEMDGDHPDENEDFVDDNLPNEFSDSEEDVEDFTIRNSDSIIVTATAVDDHSNLEVYIYDHKTSDLYVHHEIILGAYPLCMEWLNTWQGAKTNHMIVGTFMPEIEIWNLDSESCEPTAILGSNDKGEKAKNRKQ